jgi:hypothetical protein
MFGRGAPTRTATASLTLARVWRIEHDYKELKQ